MQSDLPARAGNRRRLGGYVAILTLVGGATAAAMVADSRDPVHAPGSSVAAATLTPTAETAVVASTSPWQKQVALVCYPDEKSCNAPVISIPQKTQLQIDHISCYAKVGGRSAIIVDNAYLAVGGFYLDLALDWQRNGPLSSIEQLYTFHRDTSLNVKAGQTLKAYIDYYGDDPTYYSTYCDLFGTLSKLG